MKSLQAIDLGTEMQPIVKLHVKLTNHTLHLTRVTKCHNLHAVTLLHMGIKGGIGKMPSCHSFSIEIGVTMANLTEEHHHHAIGRLITGANQDDVA